MGKTRGAYCEEFPVGSMVRIADRESLEAFQRDWRWHHPLQSTQLQSAGRRAKVKGVTFYHGGDELYELEGITGTWHETCLRSASGTE